MIRQAAWATALWCASAASALAQSRPIFVDDTAPPGGDGSSWAAAYTDLQDALDEANALGAEAEIRIAAGVYRPDRGTGDRDASFIVTGGVAMVGGFPDGGGDAEQRDHELHQTVLTGDLAGDDTEDPATRSDNARQIVVASPGAADAAALIGLVIERAESESGIGGGGVRTTPGLPVLAISDCALRWNRGAFGGGLATDDGFPRTVVDVRRTLFLRNSARGSGGAVGDVDGRFAETRFVENRAEQGDGGAVLASSATFERCEFVGNSASHWSDGDGGAARSYAGTSFESCVFTQNTASHSGGAIYGDGDFRDCRFDENTAGLNGGAVAAEGGPYFWRCVFRANAAARSGGAIAGQLNGTAFDSVFVGNVAGGVGGAVHSVIEIARCTVVQNQAGEHGGVSDSFPRHSIIWGNADATHPAGSPSAQSSYTSDSSLLGLLIEGFEANGVTAATTPDDIFIDFLGPDGLPATGDEDLRLRTGSPAIDAGRTFEEEPGWGVRDSRLRSRFVALAGNAPGSPAADIGALEAQDVNRDGVVDAEQIRSGALPDCDGDGVADAAGVGSLSAVRTRRVSVDMQGIGAPGADGDAPSGELVAQVRTPRNTFAVDLLRRTRDRWMVEATLAPIPEASWPGTACWAADVEGDLAASLWWRNNEIFVQAHERSSDGWSATALPGPIPVSSEIGDIGVAGDQIVVRIGQSLRIYGRSAGAWSLEQEFAVGLSGGVYDIRDIAIEGDLLVVAGVDADSWLPQAQVFARSSAGWEPRNEIALAPVEISDIEAIHLAMRNGLLAVAFRGRAGAGSVQVFRRDAGVWIFEASIAPPIPTTTGFFGAGVATDGRLIAIDFRGDGANRMQHAVYRRHEGAWALDALLEVSPIPSSADEPWSAAFVDGSLLVRRADTRPFQGVVSVTEIAQAFSTVARDANQNAIPDGCEAPCPADFTNDARIDGADLGLLLGAIGSHDAALDLNADGVVDEADLGLLLGAWGVCP